MEDVRGGGAERRAVIFRRLQVLIYSHRGLQSPTLFDFPSAPLSSSPEPSCPLKSSFNFVGPGIMSNNYQTSPLLTSPHLSSPLLSFPPLLFLKSAKSDCSSPRYQGRWTYHRFFSHCLALTKLIGRSLLLDNHCWGNYLSAGDKVFNPNWSIEGLLLP